MSTIQNITKEKLSGEKIGVVFGTFAPLHTGHQQMIYKAVMSNEGALVIVSGYTNDRGEQVGLPLEKRFRYLREAYNDEPSIRVAQINEDNIPVMPNGWTEWIRLFLHTISSNIKGEMSEKEFVVYTSEAEYVVELAKRLPENFEIQLQNRHYVEISATEIRQSPMEHWNQINRVFRRHFTKKVLIAGSASTGKSTLVRRLARSINAPFSEEYARIYEEENNLEDSELQVYDYAQFILGQWEANYKEVCSPSNNGITFFDTDAIVTQAYSQMYLTDAENKMLESMFETTIAKEEFDLILLIPPVTTYVDDGFRNMEWEDSRYDFHHILLNLFEKYGFKDKIVILDAEGNTAEEGFYLRYLQAVKAIQERTGVKIDAIN